MPQWMQDLISGWPMIRANLPTFFVILVLMIGTVWFILNYLYGERIANRDGIISNKDSEITLLKSQRDDYKEKLGGATPEQAKARIDALESRIERFEPRRLTEAQIEDLVKRLRNGTSSIRITADLQCADCGNYKGDLARVFRDATGWKVVEAAVMGPNNRPAIGLGLRIPEPNNPSPDQQRIMDAFRANNIRFEIQQLSVPSRTGANDVWTIMELLVVAP